MATDAVPRVASLDPYLGAALAVAECTRNVAVTGARPLGVTNCLNYGDPGRPEAFWHFTEAIRGLADACRALELPVTGGNVSLYNESGSGRHRADGPDRRGRPARRHRPTGAARSSGRPATSSACSAARPPAWPAPSTPSLAGPSLDDRPPGLELGRERALQERAHRGRGAGPAGVGPGRLAAAASPSPSPRAASGRAWGPTWTLAVGSTPALELFGEAPSRAVVSTTPEALGAPGRPRRRPRRAAASAWAASAATGCTSAWSGSAATGAAEERGAGVADDVDVPVDALDHAWTAGLPRALGEEA